MFFDCRIESSLAITPFIPSVKVGVGNVTMPDGSNVRKAVADTANRLQEKLLLSREDDTKSFFSLIVVSASHFQCECYAHNPVSQMQFHVVGVGVPAYRPLWLKEQL
jgi:hypothetical protein